MLYKKKKNCITESFNGVTPLLNVILSKTLEFKYLIMLLVEI